MASIIKKQQQHQQHSLTRVKASARFIILTNSAAAMFSNIYFIKRLIDVVYFLEAIKMYARIRKSRDCCP